MENAHNRSEHFGAYIHVDVAIFIVVDCFASTEDSIDKCVDLILVFLTLIVTLSCAGIESFIFGNFLLLIICLKWHVAEN